MKDFIIAQVSRLTPGQRIQFDIQQINSIPSYSHNFTTFRPIDQIMGNIVGSSESIVFWENLEKRTVTFARLTEILRSGLRTYVDPDRREYFTKRPDGYWERNSIPYVSPSRAERMDQEGITEQDLIDTMPE